jgi:Sulfotransferase domain
MKLIGAGLPRTATSSQKAALDILGLTPNHHMMNVFANIDEAKQWRAALDDPSVLKELLDPMEAAVDWPSSYHWRALMDIYPDAKVLLSVRDGDKWAQSMHDTIWAMLYGDVLLGHITNVHCDVDPKWDLYINTMRRMWETAGLASKTSTKEEMAKACDAYNAEVIAAVPAERLLVWRATDGWEPLCEFLDLPIPSEEFPRINESAGFEQGIVRGGMAALQRWLGEDSGDFEVAHPGASRASAGAGA